jgi:ADP-ribosylglycohydrolase
MDGLCMALHIAYHTSSFKEAALWAVNMGGDCDTVGAIAGQITGAMYGIDKEMLRLYSEMPDAKTERYHLFLKGYKLVNKKGVVAGVPSTPSTPSAMEDEA